MKKVVSFLLCTVLWIGFAALFTTCSSDENSLSASQDIALSNEKSDFSTLSDSPTDEEKAVVLADLQHPGNILELTADEFSKVSIGNRMYLYQYTENGFEGSHFAFPIFCDGTLTALARNTNTEHFQITTALAEAIALQNKPSVAIIHDFDSCYLFDGVDFTLLHTGTITVSSRKSLSSAHRSDLDTAAIRLCDLSVSVLLTDKKS